MVHQTDQERAYGVHRLLGCRARPSQQRLKRRVGAARDGLAIREDSTQRRQRTTRFCRNFYLRRFEVSSSSLSNRASGGRATMAINCKGAHFPVWSKNSCGLACVVFQQSPEPFTTLKGACTLCVLVDRRKEQDVALALMIPLVMKMLHILRQRMAQ